MPFLGGSATAFPPLKFQKKNGLFLGQMTRTSFEWSLKGYIRNDLRIIHFLRLKNLVASGIFWILFFAVDPIYGINMEQL
jgi:hypothetical protein